MKFRPYPILLLAGLIPGLLAAQTSDSGDTQAVPRYDVEVIIFKNVKVPKSREYILPVSSPSKGEKFLDLSSPTSVAEAGKSGYELLPGSTFRLLGEAAKIVESARYEILLHVAWRQPGLDLEQALPIWVKGGRIYGSEYISIDSQIGVLGNSGTPGKVEADGSYSFDEQSLEALELQMLEQQQQPRPGGLYELEGKITVTLSRYLHTYADLVLRRPRLSVDPLNSNPVLDQYATDHAADTRILNNHSLREHRRMRSKNLHYLDNPEFAMLVLITPHEVPANFQEAPLDEEPVSTGQG